MRGAKQCKPRDRATVSQKQKHDWVWRAFADSAVSHPAKAVACVLALKFHNVGNDKCYPGFTKIAKTTGWSLRAVKGAIVELVAGGWISVSSIGGGSPTCSNRYAFDWKRTITSQSAEPPRQAIDNADETISSNLKSEGANETSPSEVTEIIDENDLTGAGAAPVQELHYTRAGAAHEPLKEPPSPAARGEREKDLSLLALAPDGARAALEEKFSELCELWIRPYGIDKKASLKAFMATCEEHGDRVLAKHGVDIADYILASARNWTAKKAAKWLPKLEEWLAIGLCAGRVRNEQDSNEQDSNPSARRHQGHCPRCPRHPQS
jgi:hypothetical protein